MSVWDPVRRIFEQLGLIVPDLEAPWDPDVSLEKFEGPIERLPRNRTEVYKIFGNPGVGSVDKKWARANMTTAKNLPGSWNNSSGKLYMHKLFEPYLREALRRCRATNTLDEIVTMGCYNFRHQRHDKARPLSYHSWGIAVDINSLRNKAVNIAAPRPWGPQWMEIWPLGVSEGLVAAFESVGFSWGGRWQSFPDPMHFELVE